MAGRDRDKWIVFETPDFLRVAQEAAFWDIYYEHCSYFTPGTHARVFRRNALDVTRLELAYDDQYIIQYARPRAADGANPVPALDLEDDLAQIRNLVAEFPRNVTAIQDQWRRRIQSAHAEGKTIVLWGGGSKAVSFLTTLGLSEEVRAAVDINPFKQGKFTPGTGHPVVAPETLHEIDPDLVIVMNPVYLPEIRAMLSGMGLTLETIAV